MGCETSIFWTRPLGPLGGVKKSNIIYFQLQSQFQRFLYQTLSVYSQMKDKKHIRRDFNSVICAMTWGCLGAKIKFRPAVCPICYLLRNHWTKFNQIWCVGYSHKRGVQRQKMFGPAPWGGFKRSNIILFQLQNQFQDFLYQTLCVFSQMKDTKHIKRDFHSVAWVMPQGGGL